MIWYLPQLLIKDREIIMVGRYKQWLQLIPICKENHMQDNH